jgi:hypothetical protein
LVRRSEAEFYDAERWYADISPQLAERFVQAVEDAVQLIEESPLRFPSCIESADVPP